MNGVLNWLKENPEAANMGMGLLKTLEDDRKKQGMAGSEIAKSQYGYLLGQGIGDMSRATGGPSAIDRMLSGYAAGASQREMDKRNKLINDLLKGKNKDANTRESETLYAAANSGNPYSSALGLQSQGMTMDQAAEAAMNKALRGTQEVSPFRRDGETQLPEALQDYTDLPIEQMQEFRMGKYKRNAEALKNMNSPYADMVARGY
jgi:hypothetical protein